jgi:hypothetical protein
MLNGLVAHARRLFKEDALVLSKAKPIADNATGALSHTRKLCGITRLLNKNVSR